MKEQHVPPVSRREGFLAPFNIGQRTPVRTLSARLLRMKASQETLRSPASTHPAPTEWLTATELDPASFIQHTIPAVAIAQIGPDGQLLLRDFPARFCRYGANLLHCRSPFYLCLEHVDNLGAYTASRPETGLLPRKQSAHAVRG